MTTPSYSTGQEPLDGITVVDLTQVLAGPMATMMLGDLGAEVVKIEAVGRGDISRSWEPTPDYFDALNRNKRSIAIDLKSDEGKEIARDLVEDADVFVENMKPGRPTAFGLDYEQVREANPSIVYCSIKGFGRGSPYETVPSMDAIIQSMSGIMSITGEDDGQPLWSGLPSGDLAPAMYAVQSILSALFARERGAIESEFIEVPMLDTAISWIGVRAAYSFKYDEPFPRTGTKHPTAAPFGIFECQDEPILALASTPTLWDGFCRSIGREDLLEDDRFRTNEDRLENRAKLRSELASVFETDTADVWLDRFHENEVPAAPIYDTKSVWGDEHVEERNLRRSMPRDGERDAQVVDNPVRFASLETSLRRTPPGLGADTESVLSELSYEEDEIERLQRDGIVE